jgi:hypothetical protein
VVDADPLLCGEESAFLVHPGLVELLVLHVVDPVVGHRACLSKSCRFSTGYPRSPEINCALTEFEE